MMPSLRGVTALMPRVRTVRMVGSAALMLAWVAAGRASAYFEPDLNSWDTAAGALLVDEVGYENTCHAPSRTYSSALNRLFVGWRASRRP